MIDRIEDDIDRRIEKSPRAKTVWRERDGLKYSAMLCDKIAYAWEYHRDELGAVAAFLSSAIAAVITTMIIANLR